ncbi:tryptophan 7-halogenase [Maricaulis sp.]|uniref:tryptophan 7-halogenase n=1 Tax=Maricaulis sp. TaxID=1486257 RepID=UPI0025B87148|nr:tryptophan 7-halogenase [Maricaulis sp.]
MTSEPVGIVVLGGGLAGNMVTQALATHLGTSVRITQLVDGPGPVGDVLYGSATAPDAYNFLRHLGLDEPTLILKSRTSFSFGTHFRTWPDTGGWLQAHHAPLALIDGIPMRHVIARTGTLLEPLLISAQAALAGRFAHPPADPASPLSHAEYGYQFAVDDWTRLLEAEVATGTARRLTASVEAVETGEDGIIALRLETGERLAADLIIDASGVSRTGLSSLGGQFRTERTVGIYPTEATCDRTGPPCRVIEASERGWSVRAHLQDHDRILSIGAPETATGTDSGFVAALGRVERAWVGNCVAIGHAACVTEPLTPAPMMLLQRDIERLLELIPVGPDMSVERREFNRRFAADADHAALFQRALLVGRRDAGGAYWQAAATLDRPEKLDRKIRQFCHRGTLVAYDLEPFNDEDWTILHLGMGRWPKQHDRQVDRLTAATADRELTVIRDSVARMTQQMPPHDIYLTKLKQYLDRKRNA